MERESAKRGSLRAGGSLGDVETVAGAGWATKRIAAELGDSGTLVGPACYPRSRHPHVSLLDLRRAEARATPVQRARRAVTVGRQPDRWPDPTLLLQPQRGSSHVQFARGPHAAYRVPQGRKRMGQRPDTARRTHWLLGVVSQGWHDHALRHLRERTASWCVDDLRSIRRGLQGHHEEAEGKVPVAARTTRPFRDLATRARCSMTPTTLVGPAARREKHRMR